MTPYERLVSDRTKMIQKECIQTKFEDYRFKFLKSEPETINEMVMNARVLNYDSFTLGSTSIPAYEPVFIKFQKLRNQADSGIANRVVRSEIESQTEPMEEMSEVEKAIVRSATARAEGLISNTEFGRRLESDFPIVKPYKGGVGRPKMTPEQRALSADQRAIQRMVAQTKAERVAKAEEADIPEQKKRRPPE